MAEALRFMPPRVPFLDNRGYITREWYMFLQGVFNRIGGPTGPSIGDLSEDMPEDAGIEEIKASLFRAADDLGQTPVLQHISATLDALLAEQQAQRDLLAELAKTIQGMQQSTTVL